MEIYRTERLPAEQAKFAKKLGNLTVSTVPEGMTTRPPQRPAQPNRVVRRSIWANGFPAALPRVRPTDTLRSHREVGPARPKYNEVKIALETLRSETPYRKGTIIPRRNELGQHSKTSRTARN